MMVSSSLWRRLLVALALLHVVVHALPDILVFGNSLPSTVESGTPFDVEVISTENGTPENTFSGQVEVYVVEDDLTHPGSAPAAFTVVLTAGVGVATGVTVAAPASGRIVLAMRNPSGGLTAIGTPGISVTAPTPAPPAGRGQLRQQFVFQAPTELCPYSIIPRTLIAIIASRTGADLSDVRVRTRVCDVGTSPEEQNMVIQVELPIDELTAARATLAAMVNSSQAVAETITALGAADSGLQTFFEDPNNIMLEIPNLAQVVRPDVDCTTDTWSEFSSCTPACASSGRTRTRTLLCPPMSESEACDARPCAACNVSNGGCNSNAVCSADVDNARVCTCGDRFYGNGLTCQARTQAESQKLVLTLTFNASLADVAVNSTEEDRLISALIDLLNSFLEISGDRYRNATLTAINTTAFQFTVEIGKDEDPTSPSAATAAELRSRFNAQANSGPIATEFNGISFAVNSASQALESDVGAVADSSDEWNETDTVYLLIALFAVAILGMAVMIAVHTRLASRRAGGAYQPMSNKVSASSMFQIPDAQDNPTNYWANTTSDPEEPMRHFYPASKLLGADKFAGY